MSIFTLKMAVSLLSSNCKTIHARHESIILHQNAAKAYLILKGNHSFVSVYQRKLSEYLLCSWFGIRKLQHGKFKTRAHKILSKSALENNIKKITPGLVCWDDLVAYKRETNFKSFKHLLSHRTSNPDKGQVLSLIRLDTWHHLRARFSPSLCSPILSMLAISSQTL